MLENHLHKQTIEEVAATGKLSPVPTERISYLNYRNQRYAFVVNEKDCFVTKEQLTYPQVEALNLFAKKQGVTGEWFTLTESESLTELLNKTEELVFADPNILNADVKLENTSVVYDELKDSETYPLFGTGKIGKGTLITNDGASIDSGVFSLEEAPVELEDKRVDESSVQAEKKKPTRKKKNQA